MKIFILVVSHAHGSLAKRCASQIQAGLSKVALEHQLVFEVALLHNTDEPPEEFPQSLHKIIEIWNSKPAGFAENHNRVFLSSEWNANDADWFLIANPDLDWGELNDFEPMLHFMQRLAPDIGACTLRQISTQRKPVDHLRRLITPAQLLLRTIAGVTRQQLQAVPIDQVDWFNGASMLVRRKAFEELQGFDQKFHMYCEDVDFCIRLQLADWKLAILDLSIIHDGRRSSRKHWRFFLFHIRSLLKLWSSPAYKQYRRLCTSKSREPFSTSIQPTVKARRDLSHPSFISPK